MDNIMKTIITGFLGVITLTWLTDAYVPISPPPLVICPCDYIYNPVCGSDGITYMNKCVLTCTSCAHVEQGLPPITVKEECECSGNCRCQDIDLPVCSLDGVTYPNECALACDNIRRLQNDQSLVYLAYGAACRGVPGNISKKVAPVCGTDNVVYRNKNILDFVNSCNSEDDLPPITVKNNGECDGFTCPLNPQPVCTNDGNIYENPCVLESENERRRIAGIPFILSEADPSVCRACHCPRIRDPVCGSDGKTYDNSCLLDCEINKQNNPKLRKLYKGECQVCTCKRQFLPVCGTDRKTYDNACLLECENIGRSEYLPPLEVFHVGECQVFLCDCNYCEETYQPMCGTDEMTYWNLCWLKCNDRCRQKNGQKPIFLSRKGPC